MLEPIWLSATSAQPLVLDSAQAQAVWRALQPAAEMPASGHDAAAPALIRARAQQLLDLALRCSDAADAAAGDAPASIHDDAPQLRSAIRAWHLHRRACGLPTGAAHISAAARQHIRLALRGGWPGALCAATVALPGIAPIADGPGATDAAAGS